MREYEETTFEEHIRGLLERFGGRAEPAVSILDRGRPPMSNELIITRSFSGPIPGEYLRFVHADEHYLPLSAIERVARLEAAGIEEVVSIGVDPLITMCAPYHGGWESGLAYVDIDCSDAELAARRLAASTNDLPKPRGTRRGGFEELIGLYPFEFLDAFMSTCAPKRL